MDGAPFSSFLRKMIHSYLADLVLILHLVFILFVGLGGLAALWWRWAPVVHLPAVVWGVYIEMTSGICPLTPLENSLRHSAGEAGYAGGFIEHYLVPVIYPAGLSVQMQWALAALVVVLNLVIYGFVWRKLRH